MSAALTEPWAMTQPRGRVATLLHKYRRDDKAAAWSERQKPELSLLTVEGTRQTRPLQQNDVMLH